MKGAIGVNKTVMGLAAAAAFFATIAAFSVTSGAASVSKTKVKSSQSLVLLYTASARGQIRSCNCTKFRFGGYGRELTLLKNIRRNQNNVLLVEGGDTTGDSNFQSDLKAGVTVKALNTLGYCAMVPGEEELGARGVQYIKKFAGAKLPIIAANLYQPGADKPVYAPWTIAKTPGGIRVGIVGLLDSAMSAKAMDRRFGEEIRDPVAATHSAVKALSGKTDMIIALYHGPSSNAGKISSISGVDLVLSTHRTGDIIFPKGESNEISAPIQLKNGAAQANAETNANWCLGRIDLTLSANGVIRSATHKLIYLDRRYDEHPEMLKIYADYNAKVKDAVLGQSARLRKGTEAILVKRGLNLEEMRKRLHKSPFATADKCKDCHEEAYDVWAKSRHSHAMATLKKTHQDFDPECITCHTTGSSVRNGFTNADETPELANVQCEACHGPSVNHTQDPASSKPTRSDEQTCRMCHTDERTPDFDFDAAWKKIKH